MSRHRAVEALMDMTATAMDERMLPAMYMVWPIHRLPTAPEAVLPSGYVLRGGSEPDLIAIRALIDADGPINDRAWEWFLDHIVPGGAFLIAHAESGSPVATASAVHNPRATRYHFPFGGEVGYVTVDRLHRRQRLGRAVVALVVGRLIEAGYRHIFVGVQGWRLAAIKCYLNLGFVPLLHNDELVPRWQAICEQIGWAIAGEEWPKSLAFAGASGT